MRGLAAQPTASRVLSGTLLTETEMWRSQSWKCHFDLGIYLKAQIRSAWDMQLCGCRTLMIHSSPRSPPYRQARNWLGQVITSNPHTHVFFLWNPKSGREWKVTTQLGVPMAVRTWQGQSPRLGICRALPYTTIILPLGGDYQLALFFFFLNTLETGNSFYLYKNVLIQALAQKWWDLGFTRSLRDFNASASLSTWASSQAFWKLMREGNVLYTSHP